MRRSFIRKDKGTAQGEERAVANGGAAPLSAHFVFLFMAKKHDFDSEFQGKQLEKRKNSENIP